MRRRVQNKKLQEQRSLIKQYQYFCAQATPIKSITFFQNFDVLPTGFHVIRLVVLPIHSEFEVIRVSSTAGSLILETSINVNLNRWCVHIMNHIQSEPFIVDVWDQDRSPVVWEWAIVDSYCRVVAWGGLAPNTCIMQTPDVPQGTYPYPSNCHNPEE